MKIGILTLPLHTNYGGILQAYALQTVLERMGHKPKLITIDPKNNDKVIGRLKQKASVLYNIVKLFIIPDSQTRNFGRHTWWFVYRYIKKDIYSDIYNIPCDTYDALIVGSDQIWRKQYINVCCKYNITSAFLDFAKDWNIKRISYAASFGTDVWEFDDSETLKIRNLINRFDAVSVREDSGKEMCIKYLNKSAIHLIDPTMLLERKDYLTIIKKRRTKYHGIMTYILDLNDEKKKVISTISEIIKKPAFSYNIPYNTIKNKKGIIQPPVEDWLSGFRDSDFVVTDSFHACVFSVIFNKPFAVVLNKARGASRIESFLKMFHQENRIIRNVENINYGDIVFSCPDCKLETMRKESLDFLNNSLISNE